MLSNDIRKRIIDYEWDGYTVKQTATALRVSPSTVDRVRACEKKHAMLRNPCVGKSGSRGKFDADIINVSLYLLL